MHVLCIGGVSHESRSQILGMGQSGGLLVAVTVNNLEWIQRLAQYQSCH